MLYKNISCHFERSEKSRSGLCLRLAQDPPSVTLCQDDIVAVIFGNNIDVYPSGD